MSFNIYLFREYQIRGEFTASNRTTIILVLLDAMFYIDKKI